MQSLTLHAVPHSPCAALATQLPHSPTSPQQQAPQLWRHSSSRALTRPRTAQHVGALHEEEERARAHAPQRPSHAHAAGDVSPLRAFESQTYHEQLEFLRSVLTPGSIAQIRASSTPEELAQIELVLQDIQKLEQASSSHRTQHAQPSAAPTQPQQRKKRASRHISVASRLAEERRLAAAEGEAAAQPSVSGDFYRSVLLHCNCAVLFPCIH